MQLSYYLDLNIFPVYKVLIKSQFPGVAWRENETLKEKFILSNYFHCCAGPFSKNLVVLVVLVTTNTGNLTYNIIQLKVQTISAISIVNQMISSAIWNK